MPRLHRCSAGDREEWEAALLLRFFIGFKKNEAAAAEAFAAMLKWREEHDVNEIRKRIMGGLQPEQFPRYAVVRRFYPLLKTGSGSASRMPRCPAAPAAARGTRCP